MKMFTVKMRLSGQSTHLKPKLVTRSCFLAAQLHVRIPLIELELFGHGLVKIEVIVKTKQNNNNLGIW